MPLTTTKETKEAKLRPLNLRTTARLRSQLDAATRSSGRSLTQEVERRLERSFEQDDVFGGPELRQLAYLMASAFALGGQFSAGRDVSPTEWLKDPTICTTAITSVVDALVRALPGFDDADNLRRLGDAIIGRLAGRWVRSQQEGDRR